MEAEFKAAYAAYEAGKLAEASSRLEGLRGEVPKSFQVHELLGLVYAAQTQDEKAVAELRTAGELEPRSVAAKNNLATAEAHVGDLAGAELSWRGALMLDGKDYGANRNLALLYLQRNKLSGALPLLRAAHEVRPEAAENTYDLALAELLTGQPAAARVLVIGLLQRQNTGEYHALLGRVDEQEAKYVAAANEFAAAAALDPSEDNLFAWGSELMLHRAYEAAIAVFAQGTQRYPAAPRLWVGEGMALYSRGEYEPSIKALLTAADLNAADPRCYLFLSKAYLSSPSQAEAVIERFRRYAALEPNNALAQFYYAVSLWKGRRADSAAVDYPAVEALLLRSLALDETKAETHLQLGILYNDERAYGEAEPQFVRAVELDPKLADAHFRLGRAYLRAGEKEKSEAEFARFKELQAQHQAEVDKERAEVQQFVLAIKTPAVPVVPQP